MVSAAAGIAAAGTPVFCSSFAMFACGRAYEQIRNSVAYPKLNVKICASHGGITVGEDGATHQYCEDLAVMRATPNMVVVNPADATETVKAIEAILDYDGPVYCRLGRFAVPVVFDPATYKFELGKGNVLADGKDVAIFATGIMNAAALEAREQLKAYGVDAAIIDIHTIKPIDKDLIAHYAAKTGAVVTAEEHNIIGGLGSAVAEVLAETVPTKMARVGIEDVFGTSASAEVLLDYYKLNAQGIVEKTLKLLGK
jgi:transketolase